MKCPSCHAKLLPVAGELFCLQCGRAVAGTLDAGDDEPILAETTDPVLQRAIRDITAHDVNFSVVTAEEAAEEAEGEAAAPVIAREAKKAVKPVEVAKAPEAAAAKANLEVPAKATAAEPVKAPAPEPVKAPAPESERAVSVAAPVLAAAGGAAGSAGVMSGIDLGLAVPVGASLHPLEGRHGALKAWFIGLAGMLVFVGANLAVMGYYAQRVYPGARVGSAAVGGMTFEELHAKLPGLLERPKLAVAVDGQRFDLEVSQAQTDDLAAVERQVKEVGRESKLPLAGFASSWLNGQIKPGYSLSEATVSTAVAKVVAAVDRAPADARAVIMGANVLLLADKPGARVDQAAAAVAIRSAYGHAATATIKAQRLSPSVTAADLAGEVAAAKAMTAASVQITVKKAHYAPTADQVGSWLVVKGSGQGVAVDSAAVAAYVAAIPGTFDRAAAVAAIAGGLSSRQAVNYTAALKPVTPNPSPVSLAAAGPVASFNYCLSGADAAEVSQLAGVTTAALGAGSPWTLGSRIHFVLSEKQCNVRLTLASAQAMAGFDPACEKQNSCRIHNDLVIARASWTTPPTDWTRGTDAYRTELINHVVGQWLGFQHPSCHGPQDQLPLLSTPSVVIPGCSANWYAVPPELQDTKVLAGF